MPDLVHAVAGCVAGFLVLGEGIERSALVGPLLAAIVAVDEGKAVARLRIGVGDQRQRSVGALAVASRFALAVAIEDVKRHTVGSDERLAVGRLRAGRRRGLGERRERQRT